MGDKGSGPEPKIVKEAPAGAVPVSEGSGMVDVQFVQTMAFPVEVLLPLRLIIFNGNVRRKLITGSETTMPQPLAEWLVKQNVLHGQMQISPAKDVRERIEGAVREPRRPARRPPQSNEGG